MYVCMYVCMYVRMLRYTNIAHLVAINYQAGITTHNQ